MVTTANISTPTPGPNQEASISRESISLNTPHGRPVASVAIVPKSVAPSQCRNGANVTIESSTTCPPTATPTAVGEGSPEEAISAEHSRTSRVMADTTYSAD